jgi:hypothetical protein
VAADGGEGFRGRRSAGDQGAVGSKDARGLGAGLADQLDPEAADAAGHQARDEGRGALGLGVEDGVAAADVDEDGVDETDAIAEGDAVLLAGAATAPVVAAGGQKVGRWTEGGRRRSARYERWGCDGGW